MQPRAHSVRVRAILLIASWGVLASGCSVELEGSVVDAAAFDGGDGAEPGRVSDSGADAQAFPDGGVDAQDDASEGGPGADETDAGDAAQDAGPVVAVCAQDTRELATVAIETLRTLADGSAALRLDEVLVTAVQPAVGDAPAGFYIQAAPAGPGAFVAVPAAELSPAPQPGDCVSFEVERVESWDGAVQVAELGDYARLGSGLALEAWTQDVSELEYGFDSARYALARVALDATIATAFVEDGFGQMSADLVTDGVSLPGSLRLRVPQQSVEAWSLGVGCTLRAQGIARALDATTIEIATLAADDLSALTCPAPRVVSARAPSTTSVVVRFDRRLDPASVQTDGSQVVLSGGLDAIAAAVTGGGYELTLITLPQTPFVAYELSVSSAVRDTLGASIASDADTIAFRGYGPRAVVRINEINANVMSDCDLVELRVISGGTMESLELWGRDGVVATFEGLIVETNDYVVVHFGTQATCTASVAEETSSRAEHPQATHASNYDTAFDRVASSTLTNTTGVLSVRDTDGTVLEGVLYADAATGTAAATTETAAAVLAAAGAWTAPNGTVPAGGFVDEDFRANAVLDSNATGTVATGTSMQRIDNLDRNTRDDWDNTSTLSSTWGALNPGQTEL